jgi:hypothetical protein
MTLESEDTAPQAVHEKPLRTRMLEGAGIIAFLSLFSMFGRRAPAGFSFSSRFFGLILASLGGAVGGIVYYASDRWRARGGIFKTAANVASILAYCVAAVLFITLWILRGVDPQP